MNKPVLDVHDLGVRFRLGPGQWLQAVDAVSFTIGRGETLGVVGESGSGKSTIARAVLHLTPAASGSVRFNGQELLNLRGGALRAAREHMQVIFQDPVASLDPRMSIGEIIAEPLLEFRPRLSPPERRQRVLDIMRRVGLLPSHVNRFPHEFSGGQAQRIGIARALVVEPRLLVCDEPTSALDVSIKSQIANLLKDLQQQLQLSVLFIAHDLAAVRFSCDRVLVLYQGRVMEIAPREALFERPQHPYTRLLLQSVPIPDPVAARARPAPQAPEAGPRPTPEGCLFRNRCPLAVDRCAREIPQLRQGGDSQVACHRAGEAP